VTRTEADRKARTTLGKLRKWTDQELKRTGVELKKAIEAALRVTLEEVLLEPMKREPEFQPARDDEALPTKQEVKDWLEPVLEGFQDAFDAFREQVGDAVEELDGWLDSDADYHEGEEAEDDDQEDAENG